MTVTVEKTGVDIEKRGFRQRDLVMLLTDNIHHISSTSECIVLSPRICYLAAYLE